jgi:1-acyl-sn-glycerol-3-phosphate acyltransferase
MNMMWYRAAMIVGRFVFFCTMRVRLMRPEVVRPDAGFVLALTHQGYVDPLFCSILLQPPVRWMARKEFFRSRMRAWVMTKVGAFSVDRGGIPVRSVRRAIELARSGEVVGICPEGEVTRGAASVFRGGAMKKGLCSVAIRAAVPIVPCVILGTHELSRVGPWLPAKRGRIWVAFGPPVVPTVGKSTRASRETLRGEIGRAFVQLYAEMRDRFGIDDAAIP